MIAAPQLAGLAGIAHGFFERTGGVSGGIYASLNTGLGSNDIREDVLENRRRVAETMGVAPDALLTLYQVHSPDVVHVRSPEDARGVKADAMVTTTPGLALGVLSADCAPVLFAEPGAGVVGAAHAGWGGAFRGVLEATVEAMVGLGARRDAICAVIGPCIAQASYEVGPEFIERFLAADAGNACHFVPSARQGHHMFDLAGYALGRLRAAGVVDPAWLGLDTCADEARFFSYRRSVHRAEGDYGRQVSAIALSG
jgi:YfiH family protein